MIAKMHAVNYTLERRPAIIGLCRTLKSMKLISTMKLRSGQASCSYVS